MWGGRNVNWVIGLLAIGAVVAGIAVDRRRRLARGRVPREEISRWEDEGGAISARL
jgi:hypothetical protein